MEDRCVLCGELREDHHEFVAPGRPKGSACCCDAGTWGNPSEIPPVCDSYAGDSDSYCKNCEHDRACHTQPRAAQEPAQ